MKLRTCIFNLCLCFLFGLILSCGTTTNEKEKPDEILTKVGKWKLTDLEYREKNSSTWTFYQLESWRVDDFVIFLKDGTGLVDEGLTKKRNTHPQTQNGEWYISSDDKFLSVTDKINTYEGEIIDISESKFVLIGNINGSSNVFRFTLKPF